MEVLTEAEAEKAGEAISDIVADCMSFEKKAEEGKAKQPLRDLLQSILSSASELQRLLQ